MQRQNKDPEKISSFMLQRAFPCSEVWRETRGRKKKYVFDQFPVGKILYLTTRIENARNIQTAMKRAAHKDGVKISIQNHGKYLLIKRSK